MGRSQPKRGDSIKNCRRSCGGSVSRFLPSLGCRTENQCSAFLDQHRFVTCTLLGEVKQFTVIHDASATEKGPDFEVHEALVSRTQRLAKVNAISIAGDYMAIGGLAEDGKGVIEIWDVRKEAIECVIASKSTVIQDNTT